MSQLNQHKKQEKSWKKTPWNVHRSHTAGRKNSIFSIFKHLTASLLRPMNNFNSGNLMKKIGVVVLFGVMFGSLALVAVFGIFSSQLPDVNSILNRFVAQSTKIYDRKGEELLFEFHGDQKRTIVELDQISDNIKHALIAAEDKNFYKHKGFSVIGIIRSVLRNIFTDSTVGGSTLTQQMIRNTILTKEKTYTRKIKELILAREAEQNFSKDEILKIYLNTINYGGVNYGVEAASQAFFGKTSKEVTLAEAAVLAAIPQGPTRLSPYGRNVNQLLARKDWVLERMREEGYISKDEMKAAQVEELVFKKQEIHNIKAPHFVFYIHELLAAEFGEEVVNQGGLKVITTLDWEKQQMAEEAVKAGDELNKSKGATNTALVSLDAKTGEILAMVGSQDYFNDEIHGKVNVAIEPRQPGSSIKPIVYAAAIEKGFTSETVVYDVNTNFAVSGKPYEPKNYDLKERGPVTFRKALQGSLNTPAVKALYLAGVDNVMKKMREELGYATITKDLDCGLALVLGGCEVTLLDHVGAYTAFARDGELAKHAAILEVYDDKGNQIYKFEPEKKTVWGSQVARSMNNILSDNEARSYVFGPNSYLQLGNRPVAAKTGTTNDYNDAWTIGYTPSFVTGVWVGNSDGTNMKAGADGSVIAAPIWNSYMKKMLGNGPIESFKSPDPLPEDLKPSLRGAISGEIIVEVDRFSGKLATEFTPQSAREKRTYIQHHDILHYADKDNPRGPVPDNPGNDPAYSQWEKYVQEWVIRDYENRKKEAFEKGETFDEKLSDGTPPTEYDDVHLPAYKPQSRISTPSNGATIEGSEIYVAVEIQSSYKPISRVEVILDDKILGVITSSPYNGSFSLAGVQAGYHVLKAVVYDEVDNFNENAVELNIRNTPQLISANWSSPANNSSFVGSDFPIPLNIELSTINNVKSVTIWQENILSTGQKEAVITFTNITQTNLSTLWQNAGPGSYRLYAEILDSSGKQNIGQNINIVIK